MWLHLFHLFTGCILHASSPWVSRGTAHVFGGWTAETITKHCGKFRTVRLSDRVRFQINFRILDGGGTGTFAHIRLVYTMRYNDFPFFGRYRIKQKLWLYHHALRRSKRWRWISWRPTTVIMEEWTESCSFTWLLLGVSGGMAGGLFVVVLRFVTELGRYSWSSEIVSIADIHCNFKVATRLSNDRYNNIFNHEFWKKYRIGCVSVGVSVPEVVARFARAQEQQTAVHCIEASTITTYSKDRCSIVYTNSFVTFLSWIYWLGTHAFNAAGHMGALF